MASDNNIGPASASMTMIQALRSAMDVMLERDNNVVVFGQDVGYFGGVFRCTEGLQTKYGSSRVFDTPISEGGIVGVAVGMGAYGLRPVCEIQFADYFYPASDQIVSEAARLRYRSVNEFIAPMTIRMPCGGGIYGGQTHSQSPEAMFTQVCGLRTVMPSNPYDAKGLLIAAIENDDPVIFLEPNAARPLRLRRRADRAWCPGTLLPSPGGARGARDRLGYAVSARAGMGVPARAGLAKRCARWRVERMGIHVIKMPDIGEGIAEVELVAWHVKVGDMVAEDQPLADVMTDKATVEIPAPVVGRVVALGGEVGQVMAVGGELIRLEVEGEGNLKPGADAPPAAPAAAAAAPAAAPQAPVDAPSLPRLWRLRPPRPQRRRRPSPRGKRRCRAPAWREAVGLARRAQARLGPGHRAALCARQWPGRPHPARGSGRLSAGQGAPGQARGGVAMPSATTRKTCR